MSNEKKTYLITTGIPPKISEVLNDCNNLLCFPTRKGESLASILAKMCAKIESCCSTVSSQDIITLSEGIGIDVTGSHPNFTISNSAPDQIVTLTQGSNVTITGTYPNFTIAAAGGGMDTDELVKVSLNDTTAGYLNGKLVQGAGLLFTENNDGGNETFTLAHADTSSFAGLDTSGAQVVDIVTVDTFGHVTGITTRNLTAADIGAVTTDTNLANTNLTQTAARTYSGAGFDYFFSNMGNFLIETVDLKGFWVSAHTYIDMVNEWSDGVAQSGEQNLEMFGKGFASPKVRLNFGVGAGAGGVRLDLIDSGFNDYIESTLYSSLSNDDFGGTFVKLSPTELKVKGLTQLTSATLKLMAWDSAAANYKWGYVNLGAGLSLTSGVLSSTGEVPLTFNSGLTRTVDTVRWNGPLLENVIIDGNSTFSTRFQELTSYFVETRNSGAIDLRVLDAALTRTSWISMGTGIFLEGKNTTGTEDSSILIDPISVEILSNTPQGASSTYIGESGNEFTFVTDVSEVGGDAKYAIIEQEVGLGFPTLKTEISNQATNIAYNRIIEDLTGIEISSKSTGVGTYKGIHIDLAGDLKFSNYPSTRNDGSTGKALFISSAGGDVEYGDITVGYTPITITSVDSPYTITQTSGEVIILADTTGGSIIINLPTAIGNTAKYTFKKINSNLNILTVDAFGGQTIDGQLTADVLDQNDGFTVINDNANWFISSIILVDSN